MDEALKDFVVCHCTGERRGLRRYAEELSRQVCEVVRVPQIVVEVELYGREVDAFHFGLYLVVLPLFACRPLARGLCLHAENPGTFPSPGESGHFSDLFRGLADKPFLFGWQVTTR